MQQLQNQIRHKDGELQLLQQQVSSLEQTRLNLAEELVKAASKVRDGIILPGFFLSTLAQCSCCLVQTSQIHLFLCKVFDGDQRPA